MIVKERNKKDDKRKRQLSRKFTRQYRDVQACNIKSIDLSAGLVEKAKQEKDRFEFMLMQYTHFKEAENNEYKR